MAANYSNWTDAQLKQSYPLYPYDPNTTLPLIVAGVFGVGFLYHATITTMRGAWGYWWAFILGLTVEVTGYIFRHISAENAIGTKNLVVYAVSLLCIVLAPAMLAASIYSSYGRIIRYVGPEFSPVKRATLIFVSSDFFSIFVQATGSSMFSSTDPKKVSLGKKVLLVGFLVQLAAFSTFIITSMVFYRRVKRDNVPTKGWNKAIFALWGACIFILIRSVYRTLEFATGSSKDGSQAGYILVHEWCLYAFDTCLVLVAVAIVSLVHPSFFLPRDKTETLQVLPTKAAAAAAWKAGY